MKGVITIFLLPYEVDDFLVTMTNLKRSSIHLTKDVDIKLDVMMCLSDGMTDWSKSKLTREYIEERTREIFDTYSDWTAYKSLTFDMANHTLGCLSWRRQSYELNKDADFFIWLDTDMVFKDTTLAYMVEAYKNVHDTEFSECVITPQIVRQWDSTWDVLVNDKFKNEKLDYQKTADIYTDVLTDIGTPIPTILPTFKFAGGWFTLLSKKLLSRVGLPESFGHYGPDDTFIMVCALYMKKIGMSVYQIVMKNLIVGEKYAYTSNKTIRDYVVSINRKQEFRKLAEDNFSTEVRLFTQNVRK